MGRAGSIRTRSFAPLSLLLAAALCQAQEPDVSNLPKPTGYVSDLANVVTGQDKARLEAFCANVDQQLGVQFALVTINTIGDTPIERFSLDLARAWGVGAKQTNQGVLLLLVIKDRKSRIEVGRGAEPYITDGFSGRTLRSMRPDLTSGDYGAALLEGARAMAAELAKGKGIAFNEGDGLPPRAPPAEEPTGQSSGFPWGLILIGIFVLLFILRLFGRGGRGGGGGGGFWTGLLLSSLLSSGGRGSGWGDSGAAGGGGFGGDSGGGGGFGGFGGGDFGGGGASSDW